MVSLINTHNNGYMVTIYTTTKMQFFLTKINHSLKKECIPVGCIPSTAVAVSGCLPGGCLPGDGHRLTQRQTYPPNSPTLWTDKRLWKRYLSATTVADGKYTNFYYPLVRDPFIQSESTIPPVARTSVI